MHCSFVRNPDVCLAPKSASKHNGSERKRALCGPGDAA